MVGHEVGLGLEPALVERPDGVLVLAVGWARPLGDSVDDGGASGMSHSLYTAGTTTSLEGHPSGMVPVRSASAASMASPLKLTSRGQSSMGILYELRGGCSTFSSGADSPASVLRWCERLEEEALRWEWWRSEPRVGATRGLTVATTALGSLEDSRRY